MHSTKTENNRKQENIEVGCVVVCSGSQDGVFARRGCLPRRVSAWGVSTLPATLPVNGMTDRQVQKHYLAATTLRTVINAPLTFLKV